MTPSLNDAISETFPNESRRDILRIVEAFGRGRSHARSVRLYNCAIRTSEGSMDVLIHNVEVAQKFPNRFEDYCSRWCRWTDTANQYDDGYKLTEFISRLMHRIASRVCWHQFNHGRSHSTLWISNATERNSPQLFITPMELDTVYYSSDASDFIEGNSASGTFVSGSDAICAVSWEIQRTFPTFPTSADGRAVQGRA